MSETSRAGSLGSGALANGHDALVEAFRAGRKGALARVISEVENQGPGFQSLLRALLETSASPAARVGFTGPPGAGKSTFVSQLATVLERRGDAVGVLAVDPTSAESGGAVLGDRIRLGTQTKGSPAYFRSMASRGSRSGLGAASLDVLNVMEAFGFAWLLVETVGAGQIEAEVADAAETVVVVLVPESGDGVQVMKAGILEIADVFVVNKSDRPGAEHLVDELRSMLDLRTKTWSPPVLLTEARAGSGVEDVLVAIEEHRSHLESSGELEGRRRRRARAHLLGAVEREVAKAVERMLRSPELESGVVDRMVDRKATAYSIAEDLIRRVLRQEG